MTREGATAWPVYLPDGEWFDFWTGERHTGPGGVTLAAPLDRLPLLVRAGQSFRSGPSCSTRRAAPGRADPPDQSARHVALRALRRRWPHERVPARRLCVDLDRVHGRARPHLRARRRTQRRSLGVATGPTLSAPVARRVPGGRGRRAWGELPHTASDTGRPGWWLDDAGFLCIRPPEGIALSVTVTRATPRS